MCAVLSLCAGEGTALNSVEPVVRAGYVKGELHLPTQKAVAAVRAAAQTAGMPESVVMGIKVVTSP